MRNDSLFGGSVALLQPARGYRVNVDALVLGRFAAELRPEARHLVDLGAGVGAVTLAFSRFGRARRMTLVDRDAPLLALAAENLSRAALDGAVVCADLSRALPAALAGSADVVVSNPPYFTEGPSASPSAERRRARAGALPPFLGATKRLLGRRARAFFVYPAERLPELLESAAAAGLVAKRLRFVHAFAASPARVVLAELRAARPGGLEILPPLVEWAARGVRTPELAAIVEGRAVERPKAAVSRSRGADRG
ncbi:MAG TPA: methyltransferase [Polyangiaceae bacterium]|nr:methyltransferase [Polyangiaceae bacterium]